MEGPIHPRLPVLIAAVLTVSGVTSAQTPQEKDPQFQIEVDVTGKAPQEKTRDQWGEIRSGNFVVTGDADEKDLRTTASELELFRADFARLFPRAKEPSTVATRVIVFRDRQSLRVYRPSGDVPSADPYFRASPELNYIVLSAGEKPSVAIMREYARLLMRDSINPVPLWLETGIVEYFSAYKLTRLGEDRMVKLGIDEYKGISEKNLLPLSILLSIDRDSVEKLDKELQKTYYAESCLLFQYLLQTRRLGAALRMANAMSEGQPMEQAFRDTLKLPAAVVQENLKHHIQMSKFGGWSISLQGLTLNPKKHSIRIVWGRGFLNLAVSRDTVRLEAEALPVRILSEAEADTYRGDLQSHNGRLAEAESLLRQAIRENPTLAAAHASLGLVQTLQHHYTEGQAALDRARVLDPSGNALGYFYTAWAIRDEARHSGTPLSQAQLDDMNSALSDAVDILPGFVPAIEMLAETRLRLHLSLGETSKMLVGALKRSPGRESLFVMLAVITSAGGDKASAGWLLQRVIASGAASAEQRKQARDLLAALNLTTQQKTAFGNFEVNESRDRGADTRVLSKADIKAAASRDKEMQIVRGFLTNVECSKGLTLYVRMGQANIDERIENLHSDSPNVDWLTDTGETLDAVKCEKLPAPRLVAITYRPKRKGLTMGEPVVVEFCRGGSFDCDVRTVPAGPR